MIRRTVLFCLAVAAVACAQAPEGIPRQLAGERAANISDVRYMLSFSLAPKTNDVPGTADITFTLRNAQDTLLDYRDGAVKRANVNEKDIEPRTENGHIVLPASSLHVGSNSVHIEFTSHVEPAGKPIIRYEDKDDGSEYIYTLFVPMDASMAFPCFDQPDIKGRFELKVQAPSEWRVISNTAPAFPPSTHLISYDGFATTTPGKFVPGSTIATGTWTFEETRPISTYLLAFAAGPFQKIEHAGQPTVYFRKSQAARAVQEVPELQEITARGIKFLSDYFAQPFPFPKYEMVLLPGMAYGGMEHAGATFLREEAVLFRTATTHSDILGRDILTLHELTHQWFGDLTTMRWFDDLWLKEGFAQFMAYRALSELKPDDNVWKRFYESIKPGAYGIDETKGTTPIYQDIPNLKDAKSAYGAIVYSKAPGVIKQLNFVLGDDKFRDGLRSYLKNHAYANAEWSDLVKSFERASGRSLTKFADAYIKRRGMPQVDVNWSCAGGKLRSLTLSQKDVLGESGVWPIATEVLIDVDKVPVSKRVEFDTATTTVQLGPKSLPCPLYVFANNEDRAYGRFLLDDRSKDYVIDHLSYMGDPFQRSLLWGSLWQSVQVADLDPRRYIELATKLLPTEKDETLLAGIVGRSAGALHRYVSESDRHRLSPPLDELAAAQMQQSTDQSLRIIWFRGMRALSESEQSRTRLKQLLDGTLAVPGIMLRPLDRWNLVTTLVALNDPDADKVLAKEKERDHTGDGLKYAYLAEAARPDAANKKKYFDDYTNNRERPEDWVESSLGAFNYWNHSALTQAYLEPALAALPQVKVQRKIFFLVSWLNAFIGGQQSKASADIVHHYLDTAQIEPDTRLKILQAVDELDKTVKIRAKFAGEK
jgi:aminopeptidase N